MLKSCQYCGHIHDKKIDCGYRSKTRKKYTNNDQFRKSHTWTDKSLQIRARDKFVCQCCIRKMPGTIRQYEYDDIEVHHIEPLSDAWDMRLDDDNLISLCRTHHEMAEAGRLSRAILHEIAMRQQDLNDS